MHPSCLLTLRIRSHEARLLLAHVRALIVVGLGRGLLVVLLRVNEVVATRTTHRTSLAPERREGIALWIRLRLVSKVPWFLGILGLVLGSLLVPSWEYLGQVSEKSLDLV